MSEKYAYFISYTFIDDSKQSGIGNAAVERNKEIIDFEQLREIENILEKEKNLKSAIITNYILLRKEKK